MRIDPVALSYEINHLSLALRGAVHELLSRMWSSSIKGVICMNYEEYGRVFGGISEDEAQQIIRKLTEGITPVFTCSETEGGICLTRESMVAEVAKIEARRIARQQAVERKREAAAVVQTPVEPVTTGSMPANEMPAENSVASEKDRKPEKVKIVKEKVQAENLVLPFESDEFARHWEWWRKYKQEQFGFRYKSVVSEQAAVNNLVTLAGGNEAMAIDIIKQSISNSWKGFFALKAQDTATQGKRAYQPPEKKNYVQANIEANIGAKQILRKMYEQGAFDHLRRE